MAPQSNAGDQQWEPIESGQLRAMRLARHFGGDARSRLNLQALSDLRLAEIANAGRIEREVMPIAV